MTLPAESASVGQPVPLSTADSSVGWLPRTSSGVIISSSENTERISVSTASSWGPSIGIGSTKTQVVRVDDRVVLQLDEDGDRQVTGMRIRPRLHLVEADHERETGGVEVDVLDVEHLEPGRQQLGRRRVGHTAARRGRPASSRAHRRDRRTRRARSGGCPRSGTARAAACASTRGDSACAGSRPRSTSRISGVIVPW